LSSDGKCYKCSFLSNCETCEFIEINNKEKLVCSLCSPGYYLNSKRECIRYLNYLERIPNCYEYTYKINDITFCSKFNGENYNYYNSDTYYCYLYIDKHKFYNNYYNYYYDFYSYNKNYYYQYNNTDINIPEIDYQINTTCIQCLDGYYLNSYGYCSPITYEDCSLFSIIQNFPKKYNECQKFCDDSKNIYIDLTIKNKSAIFIENNTIIENEDNNTFKIDVRQFLDNYLYGYNENKELLFKELDDDLKNLFIINKLCIPKNNNYESCMTVEYIQNNDSYICSRCFSDNYTLDKNKNKCKYINEEKTYDNVSHCFIENIGNNKKPIYSCSICANDYLPVIIEDSKKICVYKNDEIRFCNKVYSYTNYIKPTYNCISCSINFMPYYSSFYGRYICQNIFDNIITEKNISLELFENVEKFPAINGQCYNKYYFTPDDKNCYSCKDKKVGMIGCKGKCLFSLRNNKTLECINGCKEGYIETSEGICEKCDSVLNGCELCEYSSDYPVNYIGVKRKRKLVCNFCKEGFHYSDGYCLTCLELGLMNCEECGLDPNNDKRYICKKCIEGYILDNGFCFFCDYFNEILSHNKCIACDEVNAGGIKGCNNCETKKGKIICQSCKEGYILMKDNNTCLNISENTQLKNFEYCEQLTLDNNKFLCSKCKRGFTLLKDNNNEEICIYIPILYDYNYTDYYNYFENYFYYKYNNNHYPQYNNDYNNYNDIDYNFYKDYINYPCQEAINLVTIDKPIYSCIKCYQYFEFDKTYKYDLNFTRIITEKNNVSYCIYQRKEEIYNCLEVINKTKNGIEKYDCIKCKNNYKLTYNKHDEIHYCQDISKENKCMVKFCKSCTDYHSCFTCLLSNYKVDRLTGSCVKKTETVPSITWKDIFRLQINSQKTINGKVNYGPLLILRGITSSQINMRHSFLILLRFKNRLKGYIRNLNDEIEMNGICEVEDEIEESDDNLNIVDYECIGLNSDNEDLNNYELNNIEEGYMKGLIKKSNIDDLSKIINFKESLNRNESIFTIKDAINYIIFESKKINNDNVKNNTLNFIIYGAIRRKINNTEIYTQLELEEIDEKANCDFIIKENILPYLNCKLNIEKHKEKKDFKFKTTEIQTGNNNMTIYLSKIKEFSLNNNGDDGYYQIFEEEKKDSKAASTIILIIGILSFIGFILFVALLSFLKNEQDVNVQIVDYNNNSAISTDNVNNIGNTISKSEELN